MSNKKGYIDIAEMQKVILRWKKRENVKDLEFILNGFSNYIKKYAKSMKDSGYTDRELFFFYNLFGKPVESSMGIVHSIVKSYTVQDLEHELILIFIECLRIYVPREGGPMFAGFISGKQPYFAYKVKNWLHSISRNPLNKLSVYKIMEDSGEENELDSIHTDKRLEYSTTEEFLDNEDENNLNVFFQNDFERIRSLLTEQELMIVQMLYIDKVPRVTIINTYMIKREELNKIIESALKKLKTLFV